VTRAFALKKQTNKQPNPFAKQMDFAEFFEGTSSNSEEETPSYDDQEEMLLYHNLNPAYGATYEGHDLEVKVDDFHVEEKDLHSPAPTPRRRRRSPAGGVANASEKLKKSPEVTQFQQKKSWGKFVSSLLGFLFGCRETTPPAPFGADCR